MSITPEQQIEQLKKEIQAYRSECVAQRERMLMALAFLANGQIAEAQKTLTDNFPQLFEAFKVRRSV